IGPHGIQPLHDSIENHPGPGANPLPQSASRVLDPAQRLLQSSRISIPAKAPTGPCVPAVFRSSTQLHAINARPLVVALQFRRRRPGERLDVEPRGVDKHPVVMGDEVAVTVTEIAQLNVSNYLMPVEPINNCTGGDDFTTVYPNIQVDAVG